MTSFFQKYATLLMGLLAIPALLIVLGMTGVWQPAVTFTRSLGLTPPVASTAGLDRMPEWTLQNVNGTTETSAGYAGKVVLVNFWATWCPPCVAEIPGFIKVQEEFRSRGFTIVGISMDEGDPSVITKFMAAQGINYPVLRGDAAVATAFKAGNGIPVSYLIDSKGKVVLRHLGILSAPALRKAVEKAL